MSLLVAVALVGMGRPPERDAAKVGRQADMVDDLAELLGRA